MDNTNETQEPHIDVQVRMFAIDQANRMQPATAGRLVSEAKAIYDFIVGAEAVSIQPVPPILEVL